MIMQISHASTHTSSEIHFVTFYSSYCVVVSAAQRYHSFQRWTDNSNSYY